MTTPEQDIALIDESGLFDRKWYIAEYPDVGALGMDPVEHYLRLGARLGRNPGPGFDTLHYLGINQDVAAVGVNPLLHYIRDGRKEGRSPTSRRHDPAEGAPRQPAPPPASANAPSAADLVTAEWYTAQYPDVKRAGVDPTTHYMTRGWREGRNPNPVFETRWYLERYPDVGRAGTNPLVHYWRSGAPEGRDPGRLFSTGHYRRENPDVARAGLNPLRHYLASGAREGRSPHPEFTPLPGGARLASPDAILGYFAHYRSTLDALGLDLLPQLPLTPVEARHLGATALGGRARARERIDACQARSGKRCAVVSANFGVRDRLVSFAPLGDADCFLFTDRPSGARAPWTALPIDHNEADPKRQSLHVKTNLARYFGAYDFVLWIDQNIMPAFDAVSRLVDMADPPAFASYRHWGRDCLYDEANAVIQTRRDAPDVVGAQVARYRQEGFPEKFGLFETNVMFLDLRQAAVRRVLALWWREIARGARRDQLSLTYVLWKTGVEAGAIEAGAIEPPPITARSSDHFIYLSH